MAQLGKKINNEYNLIQKELKRYSKIDIPTTICNILRCFCESEHWNDIEKNFN